MLPLVPTLKVDRRLNRGGIASNSALSTEIRPYLHWLILISHLYQRAIRFGM